jgi:transglutaminase-like putative cysteine protease
MIRTSSRHHHRCVTLMGTLLSLFVLASPSAHAQWTAPTPEELSMTAQPEVPGAAAVYLFREETTEDDFHMFSIYVRLKVLTEKGKEYANVELEYASVADGGSTSIAEIAGRTIHPDGTIIPFTGKPYEKLVEKTKGIKFMSKVFTLPDVEVGSIIEYRYKRRLQDNYFQSPDWYIQSDLFTRKAHYVWKPTNKQLISNDDRGQLTNTISWTPILPPGAELKQIQIPGSGLTEPRHVFELSMHDIPPAPNEDFMPPISSFTYRVLFYYTPYRSGDEYWKNEGKHWSKMRDKFIGPNAAIKTAVRELTSPSDSQEQKLRKLYAAVMKLENTDYTREHSTAEEKAEGFKEVHNTDDIWNRKRGSSEDLTELFVAMARAAGMKAYVMAVTSRDRSIFLKAYLTFAQFNDYVAIVNVDAKDVFFDPGSRYCPYGHLAWKNTGVGGVRQIGGASAIAQTTMPSYNYSRTQRVADLAIDDHGAVTGIIKLTYTGDPALYWRQQSLTGDASSLEQEVRHSLERILPPGLEVDVPKIEKLEDYEQPLVVSLTAKGTLGSSTGKRIFLPGDVFEANSKASFPQEKRTIPVYFPYPHAVQDAVRVKFPAVFHIESLPTTEKIPFQDMAFYSMSTSSTPGSVTVQRSYALGETVYMPKDYPDLRAFYSKMETKDQENVVLTTSPVAASKPAPTGN